MEQQLVIAYVALRVQLVQKWTFVVLTNARMEEFAVRTMVLARVHVDSRVTPARKWTSAVQIRV